MIKVVKLKLKVLRHRTRYYIGALHCHLLCYFVSLLTVTVYKLLWTDGDCDAYNWSL